MGQPAPGAASTRPGLLVFVSFSMPDATLARLVDQALAHGRRWCCAGSWTARSQTRSCAHKRLIGQRKVALQIDPQAFDRFSIVRHAYLRAPAAGAVAAPAPPARASPASSFVAAAGDVSIDYALEYFSVRRPSFSRDAIVVLQR
jgi:conjugal transfer pilus assembly protein TrbC